MSSPSPAPAIPAAATSRRRSPRHHRRRQPSDPTAMLSSSSNAVAVSSSGGYGSLPSTGSSLGPSTPVRGTRLARLHSSPTIIPDDLPQGRSYVSMSSSARSPPVGDAIDELALLGSSVTSTASVRRTSHQLASLASPARPTATVRNSPLAAVAVIADAQAVPIPDAVVASLASTAGPSLSRPGTPKTSALSALLHLQTDGAEVPPVPHMPARKGSGSSSSSADEEEVPVHHYHDRHAVIAAHEVAAVAERRTSRSSDVPAADHAGDRDVTATPATEETPLLARTGFFPDHTADTEATTTIPWHRRGSMFADTQAAVLHLASTLPAVMLGLLLNLLDAMSFGWIVFPVTDPLFANSGTDGIAMFMVSTIIAQLTFTSTSTFKCGIGSMIIEIIPFMHSTGITGSDPADLDRVMPTIMAAFMLSTVMTAIAFFALGAFRLGNMIGYFPRHILVGSIGGVGYFLLQTGIEVTARVHVEWNAEGAAEVFALLAMAQWGSALLLALVLRLALLLRVDRLILGPSPSRRSLFVPCFFMMIPFAFWLVLYLFGIDVETAREHGWLFNMAASGDQPFYAYFRHVRWGAVRWDWLPALVPTMLSLSFFSILHVPINVPALAVSTRSGVSVNRELANHGLANLLSAAGGSVQSYMVYSTSVMFHRSGGDARAAGYLLAIGTFFLWAVGGPIMQAVPAITVGALMMHLGFDLLKEAVWDPLGMVTMLEYATIWLIIVSMAALGFTEGVGVGIVLACIFFVATYASRAHTAVLANERAGTAWGTPVRRMPAQHRALARVTPHAVRTLELQGFLFFASIHHLTKRVQEIMDPNRHDGPKAQKAREAQRRLFWPVYVDPTAVPDERDGGDHGEGDDLDVETAGEDFVTGAAAAAALARRPQFLVLDFARCQDIDFSAGEAFVKLQRLLAARRVTLVLAGVGGTQSTATQVAGSKLPEHTHGHAHVVANAGNAHIARALQRAGVWPTAAVHRPRHGATHRALVETDPQLVCCATVADALEYCENRLLQHTLIGRRVRSSIRGRPTRTWRRSRPMVLGHVDEAAGESSDEDVTTAARARKDGRPWSPADGSSGGASFDATTAADLALFRARVPGGDRAALFQRVHLARGMVLWRAGDAADLVAFVLRGALCTARVPPAPASRCDVAADVPLALTAANAAMPLPQGEDPDPTTYFLAGTVVGGLEFVAGDRRKTACWVAFDEDDEEDGESGDETSTVVYLVSRAALQALPVDRAVHFFRMVVRASCQ
ncbi:hypothetical protein AMAG_08204 [Allomyces macrogynus ATCC 38327]|uniref:STAS domain-containing protein n=1 Tax=Allomyces macrogynus (strain ATCC 38327) TaxID=578462 RepID=A0A0L0SKK3_ALLM3|nr:hypothetical protein AMAG_08204 [Allomyces macrogynus ATCC 38327]|eukprot:KNE63037.1 hypothetical protein AMAG_08204 [Allomyces macrogynus ATCC 38327]